MRNASFLQCNGVSCSFYEDPQGVIPAMSIGTVDVAPSLLIEMCDLMVVPLAVFTAGFLFASYVKLLVRDCRTSFALSSTNAPVSQLDSFAEFVVHFSRVHRPFAFNLLHNSTACTKRNDHLLVDVCAKMYGAALGPDDADASPKSDLELCLDDTIARPAPPSAPPPLPPSPPALPPPPRPHVPLSTHDAELLSAEVAEPSEIIDVCTAPGADDLTRAPSPSIGWAGDRCATGLVHVLVSRAAASLGLPKATCFHGKRAPAMDIGVYLDRIRTYFECSDACLVLALVYIDRAARQEAEVALSELSCHRLLLTSILVATKFHDDGQHYTNHYYAEVGGLVAQELSTLELYFLQLLDWNLHVQPDEYNWYHDLICQAEPDDWCNEETLAPTFRIPPR